MTQFVGWKDADGSEAGINVDSIASVRIAPNGDVGIYTQRGKKAAPMWWLTGDVAARFASWWRNKAPTYYL